MFPVKSGGMLSSRQGNRQLNPKSNTPESIIRLTGEATSIIYLT
jgi:hypothetical protein